MATNNLPKRSIWHAKMTETRVWQYGRRNDLRVKVPGLPKILPTMHRVIGIVKEKKTNIQTK